MIFKKLALLLVISLAFTVFKSDTYGQNTERKIMKVGFAGSAPFIIDSLGNKGISSEIWQKLAKKMNWSYKSVYYNDVDSAIQALNSGKIDALYGPISINSMRAASVDFTLPYFQSSYSILSKDTDSGIWEKISPFFSKSFFIAVAAFLFILAIVGTCLWLAEKNKNPEQFPHTPSKGIANGMWCAIVTMTTTGYGDIAPKTFWGRFFAGSWMIISIVFATTMIAGIAGTLSLSGNNSRQIKNIEDIKGKRVATKRGSTAADFIKIHQGKTILFYNLDTALSLLETEKINAIVYDRPQLLYLLQNNPHEDFVLSNAEYESQGYGFAFPLHFDKLHEVNVALLELKEEGFIEKTTRRWLGQSH